MDIDNKKAIISQDVAFKEDEFLWIHDLRLSSSARDNEKQLIQFQVESYKFDNIVNDVDVHSTTEGDLHQAGKHHLRVIAMHLSMAEGVHSVVAIQGINTKTVLQDYVLSNDIARKEVRSPQTHANIIAYTFQTIEEFVSLGWKSLSKNYDYNRI